MNRNVLWAALGALLMLLCTSVFPAQTQTVYASNITDANNNLVASAQIAFAPTVCPAPLGGFHKGGGGQSTGQTVYANVINGGFSLPLPDVNLTNPQNLGFDVTIVDNSSGATLLHYSCVQPSVSGTFAIGWCSTALQGCDFDLYIPNIPKIPAVTTGQAIINNYNSQLLIDISNYPGADLGAKLANADAAYAGQPVIFGITQSGTISGTPTLGPQHALWITAPKVNFATYVIPTQDNAIGCAPGVHITTTQSAYAPQPDGENSFFYVPAGALEAERIKIEGCNWNGYGMHSGFIFDSVGPTQDISIINNYIAFGDLYKQNGAGPSNPSLRLTVTGNTDDWSAGPGNCCSIGVMNYGAMQHALVGFNHFYSNVFGVEFFATNSKGLDGAQGATEADAVVAGMQDNLIQGNDCHNVSECAWDSLGYRMQYISNFAEGCGGDGCFDTETGNSNVFTNNTAIGPARFALFEQEYGGVNNQYTDNHGFCPTGGGVTMFGNTTATDGTRYDHNTFSCMSGIGIFRFSESADNDEQMVGNEVLNGILAYASYFANQHYKANNFKFTFAIPTSGIGTATSGGCGLSFGNLNDLNQALSEGNTFTTTVAQPVAAICMATSVSNVHGATYKSIGDVITTIGSGSWAADVAVGASGTNAANPPTFVLRGTEMTTGKVSTSSQYGVATPIVCTGAHVGNAGSLATLNITGSTTAQQACTN